MLADLEQRLVNVLGNELPAPFGGRVMLEPDGADQPTVILGVRHAIPAPLDFGSNRFEALPTPPERQRVVRLRATIGLRVEPDSGGGRDQVLECVDELLYRLDAPEYVSASVLAAEADLGFDLNWLRLVQVWPRLEPDPDSAAHLLLEAEGSFWPAGAETEAGVEIVEARIRQVNLPIDASAIPVRIAPGGGPLELRIGLDAAGTMLVRAGGELASDDFGALGVRLLNESGGPGAGALAGGEDGPDGSRLVAPVGGVLVVTYTPPDAPALDTLVIQLVAGAGAETQLRRELARFQIPVAAGG